MCPAGEFWELLQRLARPRLGDLFGEALGPVGRNSCGTRPGEGDASLGFWIPPHPPRLFLRPRGPGGKPAVRMAIDDGRLQAVVGVTDIRLYGDDHMTPDAGEVETTARRLRTSGRVILAVGLTRAYAPTGREPSAAAHWLQVNNVHFEDEPIRPLG
jgi:hypothetical protein